MAKGSGRGYVSSLDIGLSQTPETTNPDVFNDLLQAYNAIHILNASQSAIVDAVYGNDQDAKPDVSMKFIHAVWLPAGEDIAVGNCVRWSGSDNGQYLWKGHAFSSTGIALTEGAITTEEPHPLVKVGFGPAMLAIDGLTVGTYIWTTDDHGSLGDPYRGQLIQSNKLKYSCIVGRCFTPGYLLFCPGWYNTK